MKKWWINWSTNVCSTLPVDRYRYALYGTVLSRIIFLGCAGFDEQQKRPGGEPAGPSPGVHQRADPPGRWGHALQLGGRCSPCAGQLASRDGEKFISASFKFTRTVFGSHFVFTRTVDPDSLNLDQDRDPDPAFQVNPDKDADLIRIHGFDDQKLKK